MKKINWKSLIISILIPVVIGSLVGLITSGSNDFKSLVKPDFAPPGILFPIVWTILYTLMGISIYLIKESSSIFKDDSIVIYVVQLIVNYLWSFFFFLFNLRLFSFFWIILLIVLVLIMIIKFFKVNKIASYLQIPYLLWLLFAAFLNLSIYFLN